LIKIKYPSGSDVLLIHSRTQPNINYATQNRAFCSENQPIPVSLSGRIEKSSRFIGPNILYSNVSERIESKYLDNESNNNILVPTKRNLGFSQCNIYLTQALEKTSMPS